MGKHVKIAYIGGGSKLWARVFMSDLALNDCLDGELALYDIDRQAAERNAAIGGYINKNPKARSKFKYVVYDSAEKALDGADFVVLSILPATFKEMHVDVHTPEKYGIFQSVGDTAGPGGVLRAMRTVPVYEDYARKIKEICPNAFVINFTNPMSICTKTLYDVFPEIKAFGCCHEVFHAQQFLCRVLKETRGIDADRSAIYTDACGINHFTWITEATYRGIDLLALIPEFEERFFEDGYYEYEPRDAFLRDPFAYGNKVKMDLFNRFGALAAAGDRHLAEFLPNTWYLKDEKTVEKWKFRLTSVFFRERQQEEKIAETIEMAEGRKEFPLIRSAEVAVEIMQAVAGFGTFISNVNFPNRGQMPQMPLGSIVETNCVFSNGQIKPVLSNPLPTAVAGLVLRCLNNVDVCYEGIKERDLDKVFASFLNQPLCGTLDFAQAEALFKEMCMGTRQYLEPHFDLKGYFKS